LPISVVPAGGVFALAGLICVRLWPRLTRTRQAAQDDWSRVAIIGAGQAGQLVAADLLGNSQWREHPVCFLDDDPRKRKGRIHGIPVVGTIDDLPEVARWHRIDIVGVAIPSATSQQLDRILSVALRTDARIQILPSRADVLAGKGAMRLRDINLNDLLNRVPASVSLEETPALATLSDRTILVSGGAGSIGSELCRQLLRLNPARVVALDNNETGLFYLQQEVGTQRNGHLLVPVLGDITDSDKVERIFQRHHPDIVFHAAAYKHVPMLEAHPDEAVYVNVQGTFNLCSAAVHHACERFVFVSTDKAVHPVNVLGFSKRIGEMIVRAHGNGGTIFCSVRFGNVVGSRGSALPEFIRQIDAGGPVTVTHPDVERYFMTIPEAVSLVIQAGAFADGGELFMLDMGQPIKIADLVQRIIRLRGLRVGKDIEIVYTGLRPGEKLTEDLMFEAEHASPTPNPTILAVADDTPAGRRDLEREIGILLDVAAREEPGTVRKVLADIAAGRLTTRGWLDTAG
jgi:FlaA1/EpsC-like NDP-sugar epimerase